MSEVLIEVTIQGVTPLLCNKFHDAAEQKVEAGGGQAGTGDYGTPRSQAEQKLYIGLSGKPVIPVPNIFRCIIDAGTFFKLGKSKVTTRDKSIIPACVEVDGIELEITHKEPWQVDTRAIRNPSTGGRRLCHRPMFQDWQLTFTIKVDTSIMPVKILREIVDAAGKRIGLGDFRPDRKGPFGRFTVIHWTVLAEDKKAA